MKQSHWFLVQENHATVKLELNGFSWNENLQQKQYYSTAKSTNLAPEKSR